MASGGLGKDSCPCLSAERIADTVANTSVVNALYANIAGQQFSAFSSNATYPETYGVLCDDHDKLKPPYCTSSWCDTAEVYQRWCYERWCWVDTNNCTGVSVPSSTNYFAPLALYYSYETCNAINVFDEFYLDAIRPKPPPPLPPPPAFPPGLPPVQPPLLPPPDHSLTIGFSVGAGVLVLLSLSLYLYGRTVKAERQNAERELLWIKEAIATTRQVEHSVVLVPADVFLLLDVLREHETLRNSGKLIYRDTLQELGSDEHESQFYIFISHQWTSWTEPDPTGKQYKVMAAAVRAIAASYNWPLERVLVWVDYCSIPQRCVASQKNAIRSLCAFASHASAFVIVAPPVEHREEGCLCDIASYQSRMWTRAEQLAFMLRCSTRNMWIATSCEAGTIARASCRNGWIKDNMFIFEGNASDDRDKLQARAGLQTPYAVSYAAWEKRERMHGPATPFGCMARDRLLHSARRLPRRRGQRARRPLACAKLHGPERPL